ncbi:DUF4252 domain-containing protein [Congregibacter sp.]|uniref:DUF4252 domain-containing protein n=1 Tax=Congregibacter sp. TaxID=2744308 RepID=UPI003F6BAF5C
MRVIALIVLAALVTGCGVTASSNNPGFVSFDTPEHEGLKHGTSISLGPRVLRFAAKHTEGDPQARALMESLDGVQVSVYKLSANIDRAALDADVGIATAKAFDEHWSPIVRVVEDDSRVHVFVREQEGRLLGIAVVSVDSEELVFVNMMGEIAADSLESWSSVVPGSDALALISTDTD